MPEKEVCDWCGEESENDLIGVDYDDDTGVYGSMICERCHQTRPRKPESLYVNVPNTHTIDLSELARLMLSWEKLKKDLAVYEDAIIDTVLTLGKTQTVGNIRASYSGGHKTYDYETAGESAPNNIIDRHVETKMIINWRGVCQDAGIDIDDIPFTKSPPRVTVKLLGG